ncbi:MAG TPA: TetR/AcrR family transcriptional regulator [Spirochaetota bacterium]|jgi:AcrR family transcriptional regulator|nr:TetR/AcrR family transcriptional regulator [Spirochaetota bacterium]
MKNAKSFQDLKYTEKENKKKIIIDAAERIFAIKPFNQVTMRDIAKEAGISAGAIYRYFSDQQALFVEAFLLGAEEIIGMLEKIIATSKNPLKDTIYTFLNYLNKHDPYFRMMTHFMLDANLSPDLIDKLNEAERRLLDQFTKLFASHSNARLLAHSLFASLNGVMITFHNYPGRSKKEVRYHMHRLGETLYQLFSC